MILTAFDVYVVAQLDKISAIFAAFTGISIGILLIIGFVYLIGLSCCHSKDSEKIFYDQYSKYLKMGIVIPFIMGLICSFIPSTKTAAAMIILPPMINSVTQNKELQQLPPKLLGLANDWIDALKPEGKKHGN